MPTTREPLDIIETLSDEFPGGFLRFPGVSHFFPTLIGIRDPGPAGRPRLGIVKWVTQRGRVKNTELNRVDYRDARPPYMYIVMIFAIFGARDDGAGRWGCVHLMTTLYVYGGRASR